MTSTSSTDTEVRTPFSPLLQGDEDGVRFNFKGFAALQVHDSK